MRVCGAQMHTDVHTRMSACGRACGRLRIMARARTCEGACVCVRMGVPLRDGLRAARAYACELASARA